MRKKKILILGAKGFSKVDCYYWDDELPNIPDYDIVIINVVSLTDKLSKRGIQKEIKEGLIELLDSKGTLVAIGCPKKDLIFSEIKNRYKNRFIEDNYSWCPFQLKIINKPGTSFEFEDETFREYFKNVKRWTYCFEITSDSSNLAFPINNAVKNRYGKYLAGKIKLVRYTIKEVPISPTGYNGTKKVWKKIYESGEFYFLPCPTEINDIEAINFILEKFFNVYQRTPPPEWSKLIEVPGLKKTQNEIEIKNQKISQLSKDINKLKEKEAELITYRELLYETGTALENIVKKVFITLGYEPKPPKFGEEFIIKFEDKIGIVECKGKEKSISRRDFRQLWDYLTQYQLETSGEFKGILIGNAWRHKPLKERKTSKTPIFPAGENGVIDIAEKRDISLVSTIDLFRVFCKFLEKKIKAEDIMKKIFDAKGVVNFDI
ncbi:MAG: hypothetical protein ACE5KE_05820 [Methanosarcinales archaeon]